MQSVLEFGSLCHNEKVLSDDKSVTGLLRNLSLCKTIASYALQDQYVLRALKYLMFRVYALVKL